MRKMSVSVMCVLSASLFWLNAHAQEPTAGVIFFQLREFNIPFKNDPGNLNVAQVRLYVSTDQGRNWQLNGTAAPDGKQFRVSTPQDGYYWFAVQTEYKDGRKFPANND